MAGGSTLEEHLTLHHRDGHRIPIAVTVHPLKDGSGRVIGAVEIFKDERSAGDNKLAELERLAYLDPLTGLANRRFLEVTLLSRLNELQRFGWPFGVLFVDIDHFKDLNDRYGHEHGDRVLQMVARTLQSNTRLFDLAGRWGGEEFILVLANVDAAQLQSLAEKFRILVAGSHFKVGSDCVSVTISIGATPAQPEDTLDALVNRADQLMYRSKREGRNRITV
jgi:diguanylate cyclase (GGDEF)-like protein